MCSLESVLYPKLKKKKLYLSYQYVYLYCLETSVWPWCWSHLALPRLSPYGVNIHNFHSPCIKLGSYFSVKHSSLIILCNPLSTHSLLLSMYCGNVPPSWDTQTADIKVWNLISVVVWPECFLSVFSHIEGRRVGNEQLSFHEGQRNRGNEKQGLSVNVKLWDINITLK